MKSHLLMIAALGLSAACGAVTAQAAEVRFLCSNAMKAVMEELGPAFEKASGHKLVVDYGSTVPLKARIDKGESFDLTILGDAAIDDLVKQRKVDAGTRLIVARSMLGVAIRAGTPKPDIGTTDAFKRTLLSAKTVGYLEDGLTGSYLKVLYGRLGITEEMKSKHRNTRGAEAVARGEVELGITQVSEVLYQKGAELAGPLPAAIQNYTNFPAAVSATAKQPDAAKALLKYLGSADAHRVMKAHGLEPVAM
jgi:molybdate transport system substrate-binding protein